MYNTVGPAYKSCSAIRDNFSRTSSTMRTIFDLILEPPEYMSHFLGYCICMYNDNVAYDLIPQFNYYD